ncbi:hypothetical protein OPIT5_15305 [Opitutaceae bacterium TAV5]|nr:hypothetical protein OPIT5_15305 [Opitutaceae bacterium TAV5]
MSAPGHRLSTPPGKIDREPIPPMYVYSGKTDLVFTLLLALVLACAWGEWGWGSGVALSLRVLACALLCQSAVDAWRANRCLWKALIAFPAKHLLVASLVACGILALGGAMTLASGEVKEDRGKHVAVTGAGAAGFLIVLYWIKKLIRPPASGNAVGSERRAAEVEG